MTGLGPGDGFAPGVEAWLRVLGQVRNAVRQELVARQLAAHLPGPATNGPTDVLDIGCGQGTQALRLARAGYRVTGIDSSEALLDEARSAADQETPEVRDRLRFEPGDLLDLGPERRRRYDVVCCHGVLMYLPSLAEGLAAVVAAARPGALVSVVTRNRASLAMRAGMSGDWSTAQAAFAARYYRNRLGLDHVRADEPEEVRRAIEGTGGERIEWYGVRLFTDHWGDVDLPQDFAALVDAEAEAGRRDPYRSVAALTHTVAIHNG